MSTGDPPGFLTVLPLVAILGVLGGSFVLASAVQWVAGGAERDELPSTGRLTAACAGLHVSVVVVAALAFAVVGGIPAGSLFVLGPPLLTLLAGYGAPLAIGARVFVMALRYWTGEPNDPHVQFPAGALFVVGHLATVVTVWGLFVLIG